MANKTATPPAPAPDAVTGINVLLPTTLHRELKARAAMHGLTIAEAVNEAVEQYVGK